MLADEDDFLHPVTVFPVPVLEEVRVLFHQLEPVFFRRRGIPLSRFPEHFLLACLLEHVGHVGIVGEVADTFGPDDA